MAALVTVAEVRTHVQTDLVDAAVTRLINEADALIVRHFGAHTTRTYDTRDTERDSGIHLPAPAASVTTVVETAGGDADDVVGETETTLAANDYELEAGGWILRRLQTGTNPAELWGNRVQITYVPVSETAERTMVTIDLVKAAVEFRGGLSSESTGGYSAGIRDYEETRKGILDRLQPRLGIA